MAEEKDRLGDKLSDVERAREDVFFAKRDQELIDKARQEKEQQAEAAQRSMAHMRCPKDGARLTGRVVNEVTIDECPSCGGMWIDRGELQEVARREAAGEGWLARVLGSS